MATTRTRKKVLRLKWATVTVGKIILPQIGDKGMLREDRYVSKLAGEVFFERILVADKDDQSAPHEGRAFDDNCNALTRCKWCMGNVYHTKKAHAQEESK